MAVVKAAWEELLEEAVGLEAQAAALEARAAALWERLGRKNRRSQALRPSLPDASPEDTPPEVVEGEEEEGEEEEAVEEEEDR